MSTTDPEEMRRLGKRVASVGARAVDCPVSGGCHRAATGNISILAGCDRATFERVLPILGVLGQQILHTGEIGTASTLKVMTNFLATANLLSLTEALTTMAAAGVDLATSYEAIRISSGDSFVHETGASSSSTDRATSGSQSTSCSRTSACSSRSPSATVSRSN